MPEGIDPSKPDTLASVGNVAAARILGCHQTSLEHWRTECPPRGPRFFKVGKNCRYLMSDLAAFIEANAVETTGRL